MSKQILREFYELCPNGYCEDLLTESEKREIAENGALYLTGVMQCANKKNGNGRVYKRETLQREVAKYKDIIAQNRALGELDHPESSIVNLQNVSHMVTAIGMDGDEVRGKIKVLDTPAGKVLKALIEGGVKVGISSRGMGTIKKENGQTLVEDDFMLICFDIVAEPSTPGAYMNPDQRNDGSYPLSEDLRHAGNKTSILNKIDTLLKG